MADARRRGRKWPRLASVLVLLVGGAAVSLAAGAARRTDRDNEQRLLVQETEFTASTLEAVLGQAKGFLDNANAVASVTNGDPAVFTKLVTTKGGFFPTWVLLRGRPGSWKPVVTVGHPAPDLARPTSALRHRIDSVPPGAFEILGFSGSGSTRTLAAGERTAGDLFIYASVPLPDSVSTSRAATGGDAPTNVLYAMYTDGSERAGSLVFGAAQHFPITGRRAVVVVTLSPGKGEKAVTDPVLGTRPGSERLRQGQLLLVVGPRGRLGGSLGSNLAWILFGLGLLAVSALAIAVEVVERRRDDALAALRDLEAKNAALDRAAVEQARAEAERNELEAQLRAAHRLEAVGKLAGGVAHDFNNLLAVILNYATFAVDELDGHPAREDILEVVQAARRAADLTRQLLTFSRQDIVEPRVIQLNEVVDGMQRLLQRTLGEDIDLRTDLAADVARVTADEGEIEQVLMNLVVNARDAMQDGGRLTITTANVDLGPDEIAPHPDLRPGPHVRLTVQDTGAGMPPDVVARAFEPFFTTKGPGSGTGLGLATVYGIVTRWDGEVQVSSTPGAGTTVTVLLPATWREVEAEPGDPPVPDTVGDDGAPPVRVLLVEDEEAVRRAALRILQQGGYEVVDAPSGVAALALAEAERIDVLLTDVVMPGGVSGRDLADQLRERRPDLKVLYMSGYTADVIAHRGVLDVGITLLEKPFSAQSLLDAVRDVVHGAHAGARR